jgi:hypothetical protein
MARRQDETLVHHAFALQKDNCLLTANTKIIFKRRRAEALFHIFIL